MNPFDLQKMCDMKVSYECLLRAFLTSIIMLVFVALLLKWSYNRMLPKLFDSYSIKMINFKELTFVDAIAIIIFISCLFGKGICSSP